MTKFIRSLLIMSAMIVGVTLFYLNRFDLNPAKPQTAQARPATAQGPTLAVATLAPSTTPQAVSLAADSFGHFITDIRINGAFIKGLVDTGASIVAMPLAEAKKLGINPPASAYTVPIRTANGEVTAARVRLPDVRISSIVVRDIEAVVVPSGLDVTLIGMSFFSRISSFEMRGKTLILRQ